MTRSLRTEFPGAVYHLKRIGNKSVGYTLGEGANPLRIHFTSVSRMLRPKDEMLTK